ncbi:MAG: glycosyltransferase family 92 protein [Chlamydiia bacterium]|nr:glycosyltransferase family 92 protein [Chlamydiia bacterium]
MKKFFLVLLLVPAAISAYTLSIAAIFQNDADVLKEWIEHHKLLGVEYFRLYNHYSEDHYLEVLLPYIEAGDVELIDWRVPEFPRCQLLAYEDALEKMSGKTKWLALIDTDEFIHPLTCNSIPTFLQGYEKYPGVAINWQLFGTSHVKQLGKDDLLLERLTYKFPERYDNPNWQSNAYVKCIVQPDKIVPKCWTAHLFTPKKRGRTIVDPERRAVTETRNERIPVSQICLNHYWFRSEEWFYTYKLYRRALVGDSYPPELIEEILKEGNTVEDRRIQRFLPQLREKMAYKRA